MKDKLIKLIDEYRETEKCLNMGLEWLQEKDYAQGKLDIVKVIIEDLEKLVEEV
ncbi:hypothetical protein [Clostridium sp.]|uniref:hypothetical protein n=1 Tax=Clostridium sp. TaxID=1506 RepID=UPI003F3C2B58